MKHLRIGLMMFVVVAASAMQSPEPPLSETRLSVHTLLREDAFAGLVANDLNRFARAERNIEILLKERPAERANLIAWKAGTQLYRAALAHEASKPEEFDRLYAAARENYSEAAKLSSGNDGVVPMTAGSYALIADRLPEAHRAEAWAQAYGAYASLWKQQSQFLEKLPTHMRGELLSGLAMSAQRTGRTQEAAEYVDKIITLLPETAYQAAARQWKADPKTVLVCKSCHAPGRLAARVETLKKETSPSKVPENGTVTLTFAITAGGGAPFDGRWQAEFAVPTEYTFDLKVEGAQVTGAIQSPGQTVPIHNGRMDGTTIRFKVTSPSGERDITFVGTLDGDRILFTRDVEVRPGGTPGGAALFGTGAGRTFTARRVK